MNPWDVFTWFNAVALTLGTIVIFIFFLRDARKFLGQREHREQSDE